MSILIRNGTVIDPSQQLYKRADVLIDDGKVARLEDDLGAIASETSTVVDARGQLVVPGLIDIHVHFREPGDEEEETIASGSAAAVAGGFTSVCCMPNTKPALDNESQIEFVLREAERVGLANVWPVGTLTKARDGRELAELASMHGRGAIAFSDDGVGVCDSSVMRKAMQYVRMFDGLIMQHCEDPALAGGSMHAGQVSTRLGLAGIPAEAEQLMIARDAVLNRGIECRYHVQHISSAFSVELVRRAKADGLPVTCEVAPHHLLLTDAACGEYDTNFKMNPPLRTQSDIDACIVGVKDGTIDILATDHAPHLEEEKELEFAAAPFGIIGLEGALSLYMEALLTPGHVDWMKLIDMTSTRPAAIIRQDRGSLKIGRPGDVTVIDPELEWTIDKEQMASKSRNCPFHGRRVKGRATHTIVGGQIKFRLN